MFSDKPSLVLSMYTVLRILTVINHASLQTSMLFTVNLCHCPLGVCHPPKFLLISEIHVGFVELLGHSL